VVNCTGVHADLVRAMDKPEVSPRIVPSRGTHLVFKQGALNGVNGVVIPKTKDGRLIYIINYMGHPMAGTTDEMTDATHDCEPTQEEIDFICTELGPYFGEDYDYKGNLQSAWAGLRPLVKASNGDTVTEEKGEAGLKTKLSVFMQSRLRWLAMKVQGSKKKSTAALARNHVIEVSDSGLVSLMGGKWTAYRIQGEHTIDAILKQDKERALNSGISKQFDPKYENGKTLDFNLIGSYSKAEAKYGITPNANQLFLQYEDHFVFKHDMPREVAQHLVRTYGTTSQRVVDLGKDNKMLGRIHPDYPFCEAEILFATRFEMAQKPNDITCRRMPVAFVNT
jgi:glycerol-3-phosphate dehydrogenase